MSTTDSDRLDELKAALAERIQQADETAAAFTIETKDDGGRVVVVTPEQRDYFHRVNREMAEIKALIDVTNGLGEFRRTLQSAGMSAQGAGSLATELDAAGFQTEEYKSLGERFTESEQFKALKASGGATMHAPWLIEGKDLGGRWSGFAGGVGGELEQKDIYTTSIAGSTTRGFGRTQRDPYIPLRERTQRVRDLFPVQSTDANLIDYFRVSGFTNAASVVPERSAGAFAAKPQSSLAFTPFQALVRTIAHWEVAHRNVLADEPQLQGIINNELLYGLRLHEDYQILNGTGNSEDLLGILNTTGIQTYSGSAGPATDTDADAIRRAMTKIMLAYYEPTGVVVHPTDWEGIELIKDTTERYIVAGSVSVGAQQILWRLPVVATPAMTQNTALVGAFGLGAQLYDREQGSIRIAEQHSDFFIRNAVVILAEERLALAVKRPESFCKVTLD